MSLLWANAARATIIAGLGGAFMLVGKLTIAFGTTFACYEIFEQTPEYRDHMSSYNLSLFIIFVIAWVIATLFMSVYGMAIDAVL